MILHRGRLIDHVQLRARDFPATASFYRAVLGALEVPLLADDDWHIACDELWIDALGEDESEATHLHLAFQAQDQEAVRLFHQAGLAAGGRDNGGPGERSYHPGYFAAFLFDPDGNNVEAVFHGPAPRSVSSVEIDIGD